MLTRKNYELLVCMLLTDANVLLYIHGTLNYRCKILHIHIHAIFFDGPLYSKKKITDFMATLDGFKKASKVLKIFENECGDLSSSLLKRCVKRKENFFRKGVWSPEAGKEGFFNLNFSSLFYCFFSFISSLCECFNILTSWILNIEIWLIYY